MTWRAAPSDYCVTTGVLGAFATLAYANFPGGVAGQRHGAMQWSTILSATPANGRMSSITDGTSNTFLMGERTGGDKVYSGTTVLPFPAAVGGLNGGGWGDPLNGEHWLGGVIRGSTNYPLQQGPCGIGCTNSRGNGFHSFHTGGAQFVMCDGSVQFNSASVDNFTLAARITREKGEIAQATDN